MYTLYIALANVSTNMAVNISVLYNVDMIPSLFIIIEVFTSKYCTCCTVLTVYFTVISPFPLFL